MNWKNRTVTYSGLIVAIGMAFTFDIPPWDKPAGFILHEHAARYYRFLDDSDRNHTEMFATLDLKYEQSAELREIKQEYRAHETRLYRLVDENGNFKREIDKKLWERKDDELKKELDHLEHKLKGYKESFSAGIMYANRAR